jgi:uncharacterized protein (TIGR01777 family)
MTSGAESRQTGQVPRVAITGASGFLGAALAARLREDSVTVQRLRRGPRAIAPDVAWNPEAGTIDSAALEGVDIVVNLAGEPLVQRWTDARKRRIRESRVRSTDLLARTLASLRHPPRALLSGSAIGIYGDRGEEELDEESSTGGDFLASVASDWERAAEPARTAGIRIAFLRTGLVLNPRGGALAKMLLPFKLGFGGRLGPGSQWMSWIALTDWLRAVRLLLLEEAISGPVNLVGPNPLPNEVFTKTLARVLGRPTLLPLPPAAVEILFGEMGRATLLGSQRVHPRRLLEAGFEFECPTLEGALRREGVGSSG